MEALMTADSTVVAPHQIEERLHSIWESLAKRGTARTSLFNLIVYTTSDARRDYILTLVQQIIHKFPARLLYILIDPEKEPHFLQTKVAVLQGRGEMAQSACDVIEIVLGTKSESLAPTLILPHFVPDLPVNLVWMEDFLKMPPSVKQLLAITDRLIVDSELSSNLSLFAKKTLEHYHKTHAEVADLNWARAENWRDLLAAAFFEKEHLEQLKKARSIHLKYNAAPSAAFCHAKIQALYITAWLASRLEWNLIQERKEKDVDVLTFRSEHTDLNITLTPVPCPHLSVGTLTEMTLTTVDEVTCSFVRDPLHPHQIGCQISTPKQCFLPSTFIGAQGEAGISLVKEVSHKGTSEHFLGALKELEKLKIACT